jgi:TonB family protein
VQYSFELTLLDLPTLPKSLIRQAGDLLRERRDPSRRRNQPQARLPLSDQRPWYRELPAQIQDWLAMPQAVTARFDSRAARLPDLWQDYLPDPYSWANSLLIHLFAITAMVLPFAFQHLLHPTPLPKKMFDLTHIVLTLPQLHGKADETHGGGGSGDRSPLPASRGALPPFARMQFTPALATVPKTPPLLPMPATVIGPPELKLPAMKLDMPWGDPYSTAVQFSGGPGTGGSFGSGDGTGVGPGKGPGVGPGSGAGCCGGPFTVGMDGVSEPIPIYNPEPAYSEEARKAKFQGIVLLWIVVDAQGVVRNVRIAKPLGMNLDEEAVKTVSTWKFKPAMRRDVAVPVQVEVEVSFRLF